VIQVIQVLDEAFFDHRGVKSVDELALYGLLKDQKVVLAGMHDLLRRKQFAEVLSISSKAIVILEAKLESINCSCGGIGNLHNPILLEFYLIQGQALMNLGDFSRTIEQTSLGIERAMSIITDISEYVTDSKSPAMQNLRTVKVNLLHLRGKSRVLSKDIQGANADFRAATIIALDEGIELSDIPSAANLFAGLGYLKAMMPRPHFSVKEARALKKDLRMMEYSEEIFLCHHCQKRSSPAVRLKMCGRCQTAWFCGPTCQQAAWPLHKLKCKPPDTTIVMTGMDEAMVRRKLAENAVFIAITRGPQGFRAAAAALCDPVTGALFDSITDKDVIIGNKNGAH
jgi:hypothetical protein